MQGSRDDLMFVSLAIMQQSQDDLIMSVLSLYFFQQSYDLETQVSLMKYVVYFCEDCCALPSSANYVLLASY